MTKDGQDLSNFSMLELFRMEVEGQCENLTEGLLELDSGNQSKEVFESLMRSAHSIKGAARIVGLEQAVQLAHGMENVFVSAQNGEITLKKEDVDLLLSIVDIFQEISNTHDEKLETYLKEKEDLFIRLTKDLSAITQKGEEAQCSPSPPTQGVSKDAKDNRKGPERKTEKISSTLQQQRDIRISASSLDRLLGLSGEVLIESHWLSGFNKKMIRLKHLYDELLKEMERINDISQVSKNCTGQQGAIGDLKKMATDFNDQLTNCLVEIEDHATRSAYHSHCLHQEVIAIRMRPFIDCAEVFPRMVRDLALELGKDVRLDIRGGDTKADRDILEKIKAPLNHLLRNAIDHGIESPEERERLGKPRQGVITLEASHKSGMFIVTVKDDGRGIDLDAVRKSVVEKGMVSQEMADGLKQEELLEFLFLPGFSTKKDVSKVSGRGVGLDVVRDMIQRVRGTVRIFTNPGAGTTFELQLPLTLSVVRALLVQIASEPYAFQLSAIDGALKVPLEEIEVIEGNQYFLYKDKRIGLFHARRLFEKEGQGAPQTEKEELSVVLIGDLNHYYGVIVDSFIGVRELVVQPLNFFVGKIQDINAASMLEDGTPVLIIDVEGLIRTMDGHITSGSRASTMLEMAHDETNKAKRILVVDDSITVREVERNLLTSKGYQVDVAVDGLEGWKAVRKGVYDLVITDVDMPRMDGIELVGLIKGDPELSSTPVVIVSYKDREEDKNRGLEAGADYYLTKGSFHDESFVNTVRDLIGSP